MSRQHVQWLPKLTNALTCSTFCCFLGACSTGPFPALAPGGSGKEKDLIIIFNTPSVWTGLSRLVPSSCTSSLKLFSRLSPSVCSYNTPRIQQTSAPHKKQPWLLVAPSLRCRCDLGFSIWCLHRGLGHLTWKCVRERAQGDQHRTCGELGRPNALPWLPTSSAQPWQQGPDSCLTGVGTSLAMKGINLFISLCTSWSTNFATNLCVARPHFQELNIF